MKVYTHEEDGETRLIPAKKLYKYWLYNPLKIIKIFLKAIKKECRK